MSCLFALTFVYVNKWNKNLQVTRILTRLTYQNQITHFRAFTPHFKRFEGTLFRTVSPQSLLTHSTATKCCFSTDFSTALSKEVVRVLYLHLGGRKFNSFST